MSKLLESALALAARGFHVFPLAPQSKLPAIKEWQKKATRDEATIRAWWSGEPDRNVGICTTSFGSDKHLVAVDVDRKNGNNGDDTILRLELEGCDLPSTYEQITASGARHLLYVADTPVKTGVAVLGPGVDIRGRGGYVVGAGSTLGAAAYSGNDRAPALAPAWLVERCGRARARAADTPRTQPAGVDAVAAEQRAIAYLEHEAPLAVEGQAGDETTFRVAAALKDLGVSEAAAVVLLADHWNERCLPPWSVEDLRTKVGNAWRYGQSAPGVAAIEAQFVPQAGTQTQDFGTEKPNPLDALNARYAFVTAGGGAHILDETTDARGQPTLVHLSLAAFHGRFANKRIDFGKQTVPLSEAWMKSPRRREYEGIVFAPAGAKDARLYNLWRGFTCEPAEHANHPAVAMWREHLENNVCGGHDEHIRWLTSYFAHLVQAPGVKPLVAVAFRGDKGVGKNALVERVGALLGSHALVTADRRYLTGNFNGHLENCLLFVLDEAFWSGDKQAEGIVKNLITGKQHVIEHKGKEPYTVDNLTRVVIIGNEDWIVPATHDERRFAVFHVGNGRRQDRAFFQRMREECEAGGYAHLLRYLLDYPLVDINAAPQTTALADQKLHSLPPIGQWWFDCLGEERVLGLPVEGWPEHVDTEQLRDACLRYLKGRGITHWNPSATQFGHDLKRVCPGRTRRKRNNASHEYGLPPVAQCRVDFEGYIGQKVRW